MAVPGSRCLQLFTGILTILLQVRAGVAFVSVPGASVQTKEVHAVRQVADFQASAAKGWSGSACATLASAGIAVTLALWRRSSRDFSAVAAGYAPAKNRFERKWWYVEETRDPTKLPLWQRDYRFGFQVLRRSMVEARKKGKKIFWDVRVLHVDDKGCKVEMLNSGLIGYMPRGEEGPADFTERPHFGDILKVECLACPMQRVNKEQKYSPWPNLYRRSKKAQPFFSHNMWVEQQRAIAKAKEMEAGTIVDAVVFKHCPKGLIMTLDGPDKPKGMLDMRDISRKKSAHKWVDKMFPIGTKMRCYVVHADTENGRITLSTKEFEDDDHVGWMLSFPERCFAMAEEAVERYNEKRSAYIAWLQR
ncbi:unnamed protein product [Symbiodinium natans]|uniref:S1 motif domain-containing protein n=1 Tax=Symbiodinium natans TaxID=878477 RepID=A0A812HFP9_9DINO|nr:unnamed protein product [Symbiodinium natans]